MPANNHATVHGSPGEGARMAGIARAIFPLLAALFCIGYVAGAASGMNMSGWTAGILLLLAGVLLLLGAATGARRIAAFFKGASGEEIVARELAHLPAGYHVFHSLDAGGGVLMWHGGDIDHVVVGPTGVFAIETKNWRGAVTLADGELLVDGASPRRQPLEQARQVVAKLQVRLGRGAIYNAEAVPVVCLASDSFADGSRTTGDVVVCNASRLVEVLTEETRRAGAHVDVAGIVRALEPARS